MKVRTPDELKSALEATIDESDNLIRIFNALLMIARLEAGNAREGLAEFDAAGLRSRRPAAESSPRR